MKHFIIAAILIFACFLLYLQAGFLGNAKQVIISIIEYSIIVTWIIVAALITRKINKIIDSHVKKLFPNI